MSSAELIPTNNVIDRGDCQLFFEGVEKLLIELKPDGRFNTLDRPTSSGHWALLSRSKEGGWYDAEYLPQLAAYVDLILHRGFHPHRVLFELPPRSLRLDLSVIDDEGRVLILGEAKKDAPFLDSLAAGVLRRFSDLPPGLATKKKGDETRQLAWRLWTTRAPYLWLIGPGRRLAYRCDYHPLRLEQLDDLPSAAQLNVTGRPEQMMEPPDLLRE